MEDLKIMNNEIQVFENQEFGEIRIIQRNNQIWFIGRDVTDVLAYQNNRDAIRIHVDDEDKADVVIHDGSQNRKMAIINESGLYSLILSSKMPKAKAFKRWVTSEVLPSIRKHGAYITGDTLDDFHDWLSRKSCSLEYALFQHNQAGLLLFRVLLSMR